MNPTAIAIEPVLPLEQSFVEELREAFHRVGLKATYARMAVARYLLQAPGLLTISDILAGVGSESLDRSTVFRILRVFADVGFVLIRKDRGRELRFELERNLLVHEEGQPHFYCIECARFFLVPTDSLGVKIGDSAKLIVAELKDILLRGVCHSCKGEAKG